ncbi:MAG: hypothetical protein K6A98_06790 [Prevotella sp.]|nr:hypothetical protein [Prevotella sp.]
MITSINYKDVNGMVEYLRDVPFNVTLERLYDAATLYEGFNPDADNMAQSYDGRVYEHYMAKGKHSEDVNESLARTLHDHRVQVALNKFLKAHNMISFVGVMGGHATLRTDDVFRNIVMLSKRLTEEGFYMLSGGGPGAMEATHLGAWLAGRTAQEVDDALAILEVAPSFKDKGWLVSAYQVMKKYPQDKYISLGIPTWLYGHEPTTPFATHIAKFFNNSIREDVILTLAYGGIIYTQGSAGTMQEVFQDAVQNHYLSLGLSSPMIFIGTEFWTKEMPVYTLLEDMMRTGKYKNLLLKLTDEPDVIVDTLQAFHSQNAHPILL